MAEENPPSPGSLAQILSNLFRREDGEPMDFYIRKFRFRNRSDKQELKEKFLQLSEEVDVSAQLDIFSISIGYFSNIVYPSSDVVGNYSRIRSATTLLNCHFGNYLMMTRKLTRIYLMLNTSTNVWNI